MDGKLPAAHRHQLKQVELHFVLLSIIQVQSMVL
jgi:hypothetical protein